MHDWTSTHFVELALDDGAPQPFHGVRGAGMSGAHEEPKIRAPSRFTRRQGRIGKSHEGAEFLATSSGAKCAGDEMAAGCPKDIAGNQSQEGLALLMTIRRRIERAKYYPPEARRQGIEGRSEVEFAIAPDGGVEYVRLIKACGEAQLDAAAIDTIKRAAPFPIYKGTIQLPIRFAIEGD